MERNKIKRKLRILIFLFLTHNMEILIVWGQPSLANLAIFKLISMITKGIDEKHQERIHYMHNQANAKFITSSNVVVISFLIVILNLVVRFWKEYFPNLLEITLLCQIFVFWVKNFKFWLLAYFLIFFNTCKVSERLDNIYIKHFTMVPPLNFWWITKTKNIKGGTIVICLI